MIVTACFIHRTIILGWLNSAGWSLIAPRQCFTVKQQRMTEGECVDATSGYYHDRRIVNGEITILYTRRNLSSLVRPQCRTLLTKDRILVINLQVEVRKRWIEYRHGGWTDGGEVLSCTSQTCRGDRSVYLLTTGQARLDWIICMGTLLIAILILSYVIEVLFLARTIPAERRFDWRSIWVLIPTLFLLNLIRQP